MVTEAPQLKGDVNGDGIVNIQDLVLVCWEVGASRHKRDRCQRRWTNQYSGPCPRCWGIGHNCRCTFSTSRHLRNAHRYRCQTVAIRCTAIGASRIQCRNAVSYFYNNSSQWLTPKETALLANYPNPFNPETWIPYHLAKPADVTLHIYARERHVSADVDTRSSTRGIVSEPFSCGILGW